MARLRGNRWQADVRDPSSGRRYRHNFPNKAEAELWEAQARLAMGMEKPLPPSPKQPKNQSPSTSELSTLGGLVNYVIRTQWNKCKAGQTLIKNGRDVVEYFHGKTTFIKSITTRDIDNFKIYLSSQKLAKPATINRKLSALSKLLRVAYDNGIIDKIPSIKWEREEKTRFRYLNENEEGQLLGYWLDHNQIDMYEFCVFLLDTGARMQEALEAELENGNIQVTFWRTKTGKPRTVPLTSRCQRLFDFEPLTKSQIRSKWAAMQKALNWPDVTPHTLRHTCCTRLIQRGVDIKRVMEWMGHTNINTTSRYMQISPQGLVDVVQLLEAA